MTTETLPSDHEPQSASARLVWFTPPQWRRLRFALVSVLIGAVGVAVAWVGSLTGVSQSLAMKVEWNLFYYLSWNLPQRLFERCLWGIPSVIAALGVVMLTIIVVPALYRRLPPRTRYVTNLIGVTSSVLGVAVVAIGAGVHFIRQLQMATEQAERSAAAQGQQAPTLRQHFSSFMDRNDDWIVPLAYLTVVCLLVVIAWTLIALLRRQSRQHPPDHLPKP